MYNVHLYCTMYNFTVQCTLVQCTHIPSVRLLEADGAGDIRLGDKAGDVSAGDLAVVGVIHHNNRIPELRRSLAG